MKENIDPPNGFDPSLLWFAAAIMTIVVVVPLGGVALVKALD